MTQSHCIIDNGAIYKMTKLIMGTDEFKEPLNKISIRIFMYIDMFPCDHTRHFETAINGHLHLF